MASTQRYIVVFKDSANKEQIQKYAQNIKESGGEIGHHYDSVMKGFSASIPASFLQQLQGDDIIDYIEPDGVVTTQ
ncbi:hypothetical protein BDV98DRAFT_562747 [Pterulicium gracile]|uniref:Inhibitor I9 domain-containing protein n=1 Tax=Pterulicium gracile TaxID=1884261 RepID=A0A5C3QS77_9AGAR|nr:hypothetical protein BDV98DRAFT_562747 [Pterula gracilis]